MTASTPPRENEPDAAALAGARAAGSGLVLRSEEAPLLRRVAQRTDGRRGAPGGAARAAAHQAPGARGAPRARHGAPRGEKGAQKPKWDPSQPERVFFILECRCIQSGWAAALQGGELGAFIRLLSHVRMFYWNRNAAPLSDVGAPWRKTFGIRDADWYGMLKKAKKAGQIVQSGEWLEITDPQWLRSPTSRADPTKAERMKRMREKRAAAKRAAAEKARAEAAGKGDKGGRGAPRVESGAPRGAPQALHIEGVGSKEQLQKQQPETAVGKRQEEEEQDQRAALSSLEGRGADTAGPGNPDTAAPAPTPPAGGPPLAPTPREELSADPTWPRVIELSLQSLAFGRRASQAQKQRFQEAIREALDRGATRGMLYRRMKRPRRQGEDAFDVVRQAGLDAKACLAKLREVAGAQTMTWPEADRLAFDTTTSRGMQQQAEWNLARSDFELVLMDVRPLAPDDVAKMREGERL